MLTGGVPDQYGIDKQFVGVELDLSKSKNRASWVGVASKVEVTAEKMNFIKLSGEIIEQ